MKFNKLKSQYIIKRFLGTIATTDLTIVLNISVYMLIMLFINYNIGNGVSSSVNTCIIYTSLVVSIT